MGPMEGRLLLPDTPEGNRCRAGPGTEAHYADCSGACTAEGGKPQSPGKSLHPTLKSIIVTVPAAPDHRPGIHQWQHFNWNLAALPEVIKLKLACNHCNHNVIPCGAALTSSQSV